MEQEQTCEHCGGRVTYDADAAGARANCPHCSHEITLGNPTLAARPSVRQTGLAAEGEIASNRRSRPMVWASVCGFVILCAIIAGTVSYLSKKGAALPMTGKSESASVPEKPTAPAQEESAPPKQSEEPSPESPEGVFKAFAQCTKAEDILTYILNAEKLRERVSSYYGKLDLVEKDNVWKRFLTESEDRKLVLLNTGTNSAYLHWRLGRNGLGGIVWSELSYYLAKVDGKWKIDWLSSVKWSAMSPKEFLLTKPSEPTEMRVVVFLESSFVYIAGLNREKVWPLRINFNNGESEHSFVRRDNLIGREMYTVLKDVMDDRAGQAWTLFVRFQAGKFIEVVDGWKGWRYIERPAARTGAASPAPAKMGESPK